MKNLALVLLTTCIALPFLSYGQIQYPDMSYEAVVRQKAGFTDITIRYARPLQRGRDLFGAFIPYGKRWRTGANGTTKISFGTPVYIDGKKVDAGTYALLTVPGPEMWEVILHRDTTMSEQRKDYLLSDEIAHFKVKAQNNVPHHEALTIYTDVVRHDAVISITWGKTMVSFAVRTRTLEMVMTSIRTRYRNGELDTADELVEAADFIAYNYSILPPAIKDTAINMVAKAIALEPDGNHYHALRNIYWFSRDLPGIEKVTQQWIAFYQRRKGEHDAGHIEELKTDLNHFRKILK